MGTITVLGTQLGSREHTTPGKQWAVARGGPSSWGAPPASLMPVSSHRRGGPARGGPGRPDCAEPLSVSAWAALWDQGGTWAMRGSRCTQQQEGWASGRGEACGGCGPVACARLSLRTSGPAESRLISSRPPKSPCAPRSNRVLRSGAEGLEILSRGYCSNTDGRKPGGSVSQIYRSPRACLAFLLLQKLFLSCLVPKSPPVSCP